MKKAYLSVLAAFISALTFAQDGGGGAKIDVNRRLIEEIEEKKKSL